MGRRLEGVEAAPPKHAWLERSARKWSDRHARASSSDVASLGNLAADARGMKQAGREYPRERAWSELTGEDHGLSDSEEILRWKLPDLPLQSNRRYGGDALNIGHGFIGEEAQVAQGNLVPAAAVLSRERNVDVERARRIGIVTRENDDRPCLRHEPEVRQPALPTNPRMDLWGVLAARLFSGEIFI